MPSAFLHPFAAPASDDFITIVGGQGATVRDAHGREYVDALASLWYCLVGHGRPEMVEAIARQVEVLAAYHTFDRFTNEPAEELAATVARLAPFDDARVFFTSSGSEAVDSAIKLARLAHARNGEPQRTVIVSRQPSYHGVTYGGVSATGLPANRDGFGPLLPDVVQVDKDDLDALGAALERHAGRVAAILAEPVIGAGGVYPPTPGYLAAVRRLADEHGALLICDEVICGFGRLGRWWGAQRYDTVPDLVTFAKGVTSGYVPLGGVIVGRRVRDAIESDPAFVLRHGHTYSGHPTACAAGIAAVGILEREGLPGRAEGIGAQLSAGLQRLVDGETVVEVRGEAAVWAVGLGPDVDATAVRDVMLDHGVIARPIGTSTVAFAPPLVISADELDRCVAALAAGVEAVAA